jgi:hypothetical protein
MTLLPAPDFLTPTEAAHRLRVSKRTVYRLVHEAGDDRIPAHPRRRAIAVQPSRTRRVDRTAPRRRTGRGGVNRQERRERERALKRAATHSARSQGCTCYDRTPRITWLPEGSEFETSVYLAHHPHCPLWRSLTERNPNADGLPSQILELGQ